MDHYDLRGGVVRRAHKGRDGMTALHPGPPRREHLADPKVPHLDAQLAGHEEDVGGLQVPVKDGPLPAVVHVVQGGGELLQDGEDVRLFHGPRQLEEVLIQGAPVRILHFDHEDPAHFEAVIVADGPL